MKNILIGVTGGVAAYKAVTLVRLLQEHGFCVRVVMTKNAQAFVTPLTFQAVTSHRVYSDLIDAETNNSMAHISLAKWADLIVVVPATANFIAKCAHGFADDLLSTLCMATKAPVLMAPAMNCQMWVHPTTLQNVAILKKNNVNMIGPDAGELACGDTGFGRMSGPEEIVAAILQETRARRDVIHRVSNQDDFWKGKKVVITAGPTHERIDPIRYIGNQSSGKMGYALAKAACDRGATVTLISGPTALTFPEGVAGIAVTNAQAMHEAVMSCIKDADIFMGAAAVANYCIENPANQKIKSHSDRLELCLVRTPDIISAVANLPNKPWVVGFSAETEKVLETAIEKMCRKNCDVMIANQVGFDKGMGTDTNAATLIDCLGNQKTFPEMSKVELAAQLLDELKRIANSHYCHWREILKEHTR